MARKREDEDNNDADADSSNADDFDENDADEEEERLSDPENMTDEEMHQAELDAQSMDAEETRDNQTTPEEQALNREYIRWRFAERLYQQNSVGPEIESRDMRCLQARDGGRSRGLDLWIYDAEEALGQKNKDKTAPLVHPNSSDNILGMHALKIDIGSRDAYKKFYDKLILETARCVEAIEGEVNGRPLPPNYTRRLEACARKNAATFDTDMFFPVWEQAIHADCKATWSPGNGIYRIEVAIPFLPEKLMYRRATNTPPNMIHYVWFGKKFESASDYQNAIANHNLIGRQYIPARPLLADDDNQIIVTCYADGIPLDKLAHVPRGTEIENATTLNSPIHQEELVDTVITAWIDTAGNCSEWMSKNERDQLASCDDELGRTLTDFVAYAVLRYEPNLLQTISQEVPNPLNLIATAAKHHPSLQHLLQALEPTAHLLDSDVQTLTHGDFHPGNVLITKHNKEPYVPVFLDFENLQIASVHLDLVEILKKMRLAPEEYRTHLIKTHKYLVRKHVAGNTYQQRGLEDFLNRNAAARFFEYLKSASKYLLLSRYAPEKRELNSTSNPNLLSDITAPDLRSLASVNYTEALNLIRNGKLTVQNKDAVLQSIRQFNTIFYSEKLEDLGTEDLRRDCYLPHPDDHRSVSNAGIDALRARYLARKKRN